MSVTAAEKHAILQQLGVTQDQVIFYYSGKTRGQYVSLYDYFILSNLEYPPRWTHASVC
jgi:hypothetical protein